MITYIIENKLEEVEINDGTMRLHIEKVIDDYVTKNTSVLEKNKEDMRKRLLVYFGGEDFMKTKFGDMIDVLLKNAKTWDVHSLIVVYYHFILSSLTENNGEISLTDNNEIMDMIDDMENYILSIPNERESLDKIKEKMNKHYKAIMLKETKATKLLLKKDISEDKILYIK